MRGYVRKRDKDVYQLVVELPNDPISGRRRQQFVTVHGSKRKADYELQRLLMGAKDTKARSSTQSIETAMNEWFERVAPGLAPTTVIGYQGRIRRQILPALGDLAIGEVTASHLDRLYQDLVAQGSSPASIRQTHAIIRRFFNQAMKWGWTESNPALLASPPRVTTPTVVAPTREQLIQIVERAKALHPQWEAFFVLAALTGMRRGELCALHWDDCSDGGIKVTKSLIYTSAGGTREAPTKTHQGRYVALDEFGRSVVSEQQERLRQAARSLGIGHVGNPYLFYSSPDGSVPVHPDSPSKLFRRIADNLGYRELHLHSLRHFAATQLVAAGMDIRTVSGRLGHADASTTLRVYSHVLEAKNQEAAAIMGALLHSPTETRVSSQE